MSTATDAESISRLIHLCRAYGACAQLFSSLAGNDAPPTGTISELSTLLRSLGLEELRPVMQRVRETICAGGTARTTPLYETSYDEGADKPLQLADIAGFYRAFGFQVTGERPDHLVAELEFLSLTCLKEAFALLSGETENARVCSEARSRFLSEHMLPWLRQLEERAAVDDRRLASLAAVTGSLALAGLTEPAAA